MYLLIDELETAWALANRGTMWQPHFDPRTSSACRTYRIWQAPGCGSHAELPASSIQWRAMPDQTSRRSLFLASLRYGLLARLTGLLGAPAATVTLPVRGAGPDVYQRLGVEPFINCTSTYTINGGSRQLPEVIAAVEKASHYHVNIDELMAKAGPRIAELLGGPAAMVSSGAAGAVTCGAAACVAGGDPEKMQKLPDTLGMKSECVVPKWSRSYYDHSVRAVGVRMIEVGTLAELERALGPQTALAHGQANMLAGLNSFTLRQ